VSKAALNHMTVLLANALGPEIRVNAVAPGLIDTPWTEEWDDVRTAVRDTAPLRRSGTPQDVADACVGLIGARYATGQVLVVDGGIALR
jgi:ketoreductase RED2